MTSKKTKYIVCTIDDNYVQHFIVMLLSLFKQNNNNKYHIFIITNNLAQINLKIISRFFRFKKHTFEIKYVDELLLKDAPVYGHVSLATYYRLLISLLLPKEIHKVLFLDSDIIIVGNIDIFWEFEVSTYSHIAIENSGDNKPFIKKLEIPGNSKYFNAGIMLVNLNWWREHDVYSRSIEYLKINSEKITFWDQDVLNAILFNDWYEFPLSYNAQSFLFSEHLPTYLQKEKEAINSPKIIHFTGGGDSKPWYFSNKHPYKKEYEYYLSKTVFKNSVPIGTPILKKLTFRDKFYLLRKKIFNNQKDYNI